MLDVFVAKKCPFFWGKITGTTNESEYLRDATGGRRFWGVTVGNINLEKIKDDREQLFAEAIARYQRGETWWEMPEETKIEQESRRQEDPWESAIEVWLANKPIETTTAREVLVDALDVEVSRHSPREFMRVANVLKLLGWEKFQTGDSRCRTKSWRRIK